MMPDHYVGDGFDDETIPWDCDRVYELGDEDFPPYDDGDEDDD